MVPDPIAHSPLRPASRRPRDQADARPKEKIRLIKVDQQTHTHTHTHTRARALARNEEHNASSPAPGRLAFAIDLISLARSPGGPSCAPPEPSFRSIDRSIAITDVRNMHDQSPRNRNHCIAGGGGRCGASRWYRRTAGVARGARRSILRRRRVRTSRCGRLPLPRSRTRPLRPPSSSSTS